MIRETTNCLTYGDQDIVCYVHPISPKPTTFRCEPIVRTYVGSLGQTIWVTEGGHHVDDAYARWDCPDCGEYLSDDEMGCDTCYELGPNEIRKLESVVA